MKSLWKISLRYIVTAVTVVFFVLTANGTAFLMYGYFNINQSRKRVIGSQLMEDITQQISVSDGAYVIGKKGRSLLRDSSFVWALRLDAEGDVVWSYELPKEIPRKYSIADAAVFSRWYLKDYPVRVWKDKDELMVFGMEKQSVVRLNLFYDYSIIKHLPQNVGYVLILNAVFILLLALLFGYRFYRSLKPITEGVERLSRKEALCLPVKGMTDELAEKLNQVSLLLRQQDEKLVQRDNARTSWISGVSHDIRTPLALIIGYSDELAEDWALPENARKRAEMIRSQSLVIRQLISDLNLTSKLEYQAQPLRQSYLSLAVLLRECVAEYYNQGLDENYELEAQIKPQMEAMQIYGDAELLKRAIRNLIGNSIRHNPDGCQIFIRLEMERSQASLFFLDTGAGIQETVARAVLTGEQPEGVHIMGLRIVSQIAGAHGGRLEFAAREDETYDAKLLLPLADCYFDRAAHSAVQYWSP